LSQPVKQQDDDAFQKGQRDREIFDLFDEISDLPPDERAAFLDARCGSQGSSIRVEIERLLASFDKTGLLDESMPRGLGLRTPTPLPLFAPGYVIANRFRIVRTIGSGGMGMVYEAEDLDGGNNVALKTIRAGEIVGGELTKRLRRELRLSRDISHENVCRVYEYWDIDDAGAGLARMTFFTMELLEGETLAQRLAAKGKMEQAKAIAILRQIAAGIDEVHRSEIVHRDLKPSNIFLARKAGGTERAVVMDFGVARNDAAAAASNSNATVTGALIGTPRYMSPEQANGEKVDRSSDIYSFGVLALEMVTGVNHPLVAPSTLTPGLRKSWDNAVLRCFASPAQRPKSAGDVVAEIERRTIPWKPAATVLAAGLVLAVVFWLASRSGAAARYGSEGATQITFDDGFTGDPATTADGKILVYATDRGSVAGDLNIWSQRLDTNETKQLTATPGDEDEPAISPDGRMLAYRKSSTNTLYVKALPDGEPREVGNWMVAPRFSPDGKTLAYWSGHTSSTGQIWLLSLSPGSQPNRLAADFLDARFPLWSPDGEKILFRGARSLQPSLEANQEWWITDREGRSYKATGARERLSKSNVTPHSTPAAWDGDHVVFSAANGDSTNLWRLNLFSIFGFLPSDPEVITTGSGYQGIPAMLADGRVAYADWRHEGHIWRIDPVSGKMTQVTTRSSKDAAVTSSTDGTRLAFVRIRSKARDIWTRDMTTGAERELLTGEAANPLLSPSGDSIAISTGTRISLLEIASGKRVMIDEKAGQILTWTPDGSGLVFVENRAENRQAVVLLRLRDRSRNVLAEGRGFYQAGYSPDGKLLAVCTRPDSGHSQILIAAIRPDGSVSGSWKPATGLDHWSERPVWASEGNKFYYFTDRDGFWCVFTQAVDPVTLTPLGEPKALAHLHTATNTLSHLVDASSGLARGGQHVYLCVGSERSNIWAVRP
jgi:eukaryotic-like serine/threonine-protein kinase